MPEKRSHFNSEAERIKHQVKVWMWLITFAIWGAVGIGAVFLLAKLIELVWVKMGN